MNDKPVMLIEDNPSNSRRLATATGRRPAGPSVNALPKAGPQSYDGRAAAGFVLCSRKEVLAMFTHRQTPPGIAL
jgi:hypothetical protein